jgi:hypothetical protein
MKLDANPFPIDLINFEEKKILVHTSQADTTKGKNVIVSDEPRSRMIKPRQPKVGVWKVNERRVGQSGGRHQVSWKRNTCGTGSVANATDWEEAREDGH